MLMLVGQVGAQASGVDAAELRLATETLDAMGGKADLMSFAQEYTDDVVTSQSKLHRLNADQVNALAEAIRSVLDRYTDNFYNMKRDSLAVTFSAKELTQIKSFYDSEVGRKLSREQLDAGEGLREVQHSSNRNLRQEIFTVAASLTDGTTSMPAQPETKR